MLRTISSFARRVGVAVVLVSEILANAEMLEHGRLIGGVTVLLHQQRLGVNLPLGGTG